MEIAKFLQWFSLFTRLFIVITEVFLLNTQQCLVNIFVSSTHGISREMMKQSLKICPKELAEGPKEDSWRLCINMLN